MSYYVQYRSPYLCLDFDSHVEVNMPFWQRLLITVVIMLASGFIVDAIWRTLFIIGIPSYLAGGIGGLTALPAWELLKRIKPKGNK